MDCKCYAIRWGKFKPWILIGTLANSVIFFSSLVRICLKVLLRLSLFAYLHPLGHDLHHYGYSLLVAGPTITLDKREREQLVPYPRFLPVWRALLRQV